MYAPPSIIAQTRPTLRLERRHLTKRHPLAISRGSTAGSENLFAHLTLGEHAGVGELAPATGSPWTAQRGEAQLRTFWEGYGGDINPADILRAMIAAGVDPPARAALDIALWDLIARRAGMPLYALLGLPRRCVPTSVTVGLNAPDVTRAQVPEILARTGARFLKIKLGSPDGLDQDQDHFAAAAEAAAPFGAGLRVDANGGWEPEDAITMDAWLAARGVESIEQPVAEGREGELPSILRRRTLPIYLDESCRLAADVPRLAAIPGFEPGRDGVNLKLMKCGGITEALRIAAVARACGLRAMIGCMSDSSVGIAAGASIGSLFDQVDLDSHLNLAADPADGASIVNGIVLPADRPGHGGRLT